MAYLRWFVVVSLVLVAQAEGLAPAKNVHRGEIVDAVTDAPIEADAAAYASNQVQGGTPDCPAYGSLLNQTHSTAGDFAFRIDNTVASFTAVYCQPAYASNTVDGNDNSVNGSPVAPHPVPLYPNQSTLSHRGMKPVDAAYLAIGRVLYTAELNLAYFSRADEGSYYQALEAFHAGGAAHSSGAQRSRQSCRAL